MSVQSPSRRAAVARALQAAGAASVGGLLGAAGIHRTVHAESAPGSSAPTVNALTPWRPSRRPELQATDLLTGQPRTLADFAGHPLVINFWASWCAPCRTELPSLNAAIDRFAARGLRLLAVNHGEMPARVRSFAAQVPIHGTVLLDRSPRACSRSPRGHVGAQSGCAWWPGAPHGLTAHASGRLPRGPDFAPTLRAAAWPGVLRRCSACA